MCYELTLSMFTAWSNVTSGFLCSIVDTTINVWKTKNDVLLPAKTYFLVPYRLAGGDSYFAPCLSVSQSVCQSVRHTLVFHTFLCHLLRYWLDIWYMNLSWHYTDQVWVSSRLTYFYGSYCPLLKFSFPDFSLLSFEILTWYLVYEFVMTLYRSSLSFVTLDLLLRELLPFAKI